MIIEEVEEEEEVKDIQEKEVIIERNQDQDQDMIEEKIKHIKHLNVKNLLILIRN